MFHQSSMQDLPSIKLLYKRLVKKIMTNEPTKKLQLKHQIQNKYKRHMTLLQSHKKRELRFEENHQSIKEKQQQKKKSLQNLFKEKQQNIKNSKQNQLNKRKKKMQQYLDVWKNTVDLNKKKYDNSIRDSSHAIKKWNQKCQDSINKKKQRLDTVSSRISQRSRISSAKTLKYQQQQYEKMLQKALLNPQTSFSRLKTSKGISSRVSTTSNISFDRNRQIYEKKQTQKNEKVLEKLLFKQKRIVQARNKKNQLIEKFRSEHHKKQTQINQLHKQNNRNLNNKRDQMQDKLDAKFFQNRKSKKQANRSLPAISPKSNHIEIINNLNGRNFHSIKLKDPHPHTVEHNFDKLIMDQLRSITIVSKIKKQLK